jgi:hypothetical protein
MNDNNNRIMNGLAIIVVGIIAALAYIAINLFE